MAQIHILLNAPGWTVASLQKAVHDLDEFSAGAGNGITAENVKALDVLTYILCCELGVVVEPLINNLED